MAKGNKGFGSSLTEGLDEAAEPDRAPAAESVMASRSEALSKLATGKVVTDRTEWVDPDKCRPWRLHNRDLDHLDEESCRDLIDGFLSAKKQRIPAIVRKLKDDPDYEYEIVAGVRRWWTVKWLRENHHPEFDYLVTVQRVSDEEAFRISDIENRTRKDISDWERAKEYTRALAEFYHGSQNEMAEHLNISKSWLSRLLDVARLPDAILVAFLDKHEITVRVARDLKPLAAERRSLDLMATEADEIAKELGETGVQLSGAEIAKRLVSVTLPPKEKTKTEEEIKGTGGKAILRIVRGPRGSLTLKVVPKSGATTEELLKVIKTVLEKG